MEAMKGWESVKARLEDDCEHFVGMEDHKADIRAALKRVEELERRELTLRNECEYQTERAEAAEAKLARCVWICGHVGKALAAAKGE
jgi:hypothetical protein